MLQKHVSSKEDIKQAIRMLYEEIAEFRYDYPLMVLPEAGPRTFLHYFLYKFAQTPYHRPVARLDSRGIPRGWGRPTANVYRPAFVAMYELSYLNSYLLTGDHKGLDIFLNQVSW